MPKKKPITSQEAAEQAAERAITMLMEHGDTVVVLMTIPGETETKLISKWRGNQFAAQKIAEQFDAFPPPHDDDDDLEHGPEDPSIPVG